MKNEQIEQKSASLPKTTVFNSFFLIGLTCIFAFTIKQGDFEMLALVYTLFFIISYHSYWLLPFNLPSNKPNRLTWFLSLAIALRLIVVFALPNLSDDYFRFVWDGRLLVNGIHPLAQLPSYYLENPVPSLDFSLYENLNSKTYFTVYPPFCQSVFATACWFFPNSIYGSVVLMKFIFLVLEIGSIALLLSLLRAFNLPQKSVLLYALNPLILLETFANLHFEIAMVFFVLLSLWLLVKARWLSAALAMAFGVATKLLPLLFLPFLLKRLFGRKADLKRGILSIVVGAVVLGLLFWPLLGSFANNFGESLNLYFQRFEFNASIYYLLRKIGYLLVGYNLIRFIGTALILLAGLAILFFAYHEKARSWASLPQMWLLALTLFLLATTTVHPWYLTGLVALCVLTPWRFPIVWSLLAMGSYMNYAGAEYKEQLWWVTIEYGLVFGFIYWEFFTRKKHLGSVITSP